MKKWLNIVVIAMVWMAGGRSGAAILVRDTFDTAEAADPSGGIYQHDAGVVDTAHIGGEIKGFDASQAWTATSAYLRAHDGALLGLVGYTASRVGSRQLAAGTMSEKTAAYGRVDFNFDVPAAYNQGTTKIGFTTESASSAVGATVRINWDSVNSEWDIDVIYNNGSLTVSNVASGISLNTDYTVIWAMDETADTLKVWVNASSSGAAPTAKFTDYAGSVSSIDDLYVQFSGFDDVDGASTTERDGIRYDHVALADDIDDLFPALLVFDEFVTDVAADSEAGIYDAGTDLSDPVNQNVDGGTIVGFGSTNLWVASAFYDAYAQKVRMVGRTSTSAATATRPLAVSLAGKTEAYASLVMRVGGDAMDGGQVLAGFSDSILSSTVGAAAGYKWDGANWDMVLRYRNTGGATFAIIQEDVLHDVYNTFYWSMNSANDIINVWVNNNDYSSAADLRVTDWIGSVDGIDSFTSNLHRTGSGNDAYLDTIQLGRTAEAVGMISTPRPGLLFVLSGPPDTDLCVAPDARGSGFGSDPDNAAAYTNEAFWVRVQEQRDSAPVTVLFLEGNYTEPFALSSTGTVEHVLTLTGESTDGVIFNGVNGTLFDLKGCQNMVVENLNFTGGGTGVGYAFRVSADTGGTVSEQITIQNCNWYDMEQIVYGATGVSYGSHHVVFENCTFERIGLNTGSHMMYHAYDADYVSVVNCHFEDCSGSYVRFRAGSDYGLVSGCTFVSTQTYANRAASTEVFVEFPVFNDVDPGDETFAQFPVVTSNMFQFHSGEPASRKSVNFYHKGYDPTGWNYLMSASEGVVLEGADTAAKKSLLKNNCGIDFDEIVISGNTWQNETDRIRFASYAAYGAVSKGWEGTVDVSGIVFGP